MLTHLHPDVTRHLLSMPEGFTAPITVTPDHKVVKWAAAVTVDGQQMRLEYGLRIPPNADGDTMSELLESVRATAWQTLELARIGRADLIAYLRTDRHAARPPKAPLSAEARDLLGNIQRAHAERMSKPT